MCSLDKGNEMPKFIDRTGFRYGRLTVVAEAGRSSLKKVLWRCLCDCGKELIVDACRLQTANTTSCGCYLKDRLTKHGGSGKGSYNTWRSLVRRCTNPKDKDYPRYGGMGVTISEEWLSYLKFKEDMGEPPTDKHSLDRIDPYGGYNKDNCRWATILEQNRNIRSFGKTRGVSLRGNRWYAIIGLDNRQIYSRGFLTKEEAIAERKRQEQVYWGSRS